MELVQKAFWKERPLGQPVQVWGRRNLGKPSSIGGNSVSGMVIGHTKSMLGLEACMLVAIINPRKNEARFHGWTSSTLSVGKKSSDEFANDLTAELAEL